jgi:hypothetical protein
MIRRQTWILLAVLAVAIGAVVYLQQNPSVKLISSGTATPTAYPRPFEALSSESLTKIEINTSNGSALVMQRNSDKTWGIVNFPKQVDQGKAEQLSVGILALNPISQLDSKGSLDTFGLTKAPISIVLEDSTGGKKTLKIGSKTPTNSGYYAQVDNGTVFVADTNAIEEIQGFLSVEALVLTTPTPEPAAPQSPTTAP